MKQSKYGARFTTYQPQPKDPYMDEFISGGCSEDSVLEVAIDMVKCLTLTDRGIEATFTIPRVLAERNGLA